MAEKLDETPAEEFSRLVIEYNEGERQHRAEAWNLIADFALEHCDAIIRALAPSAPSRAKAVAYAVQWPCGGKLVWERHIAETIVRADETAVMTPLYAHPLPAEVGRVLEPFARESERWEPKGGVYWPDAVPFPASSISGIKIGDLRAARALLSRLRAGEQEGWRHGPYGYLIKPIGLNEEHWHLATEPSAYPDEEVSVPLYADQDQFPAAPKQGEAK